MRCAKQRNSKVNWRYREANNNNGAQTVNILCGYYKPLSLPLKVLFVFLYLDFVFISSFYDFPSFCHPNILLIVCVLLLLFFCCVAVCDYLDRMFLLHIGMFFTIELTRFISALRLCLWVVCVWCVRGRNIMHCVHVTWIRSFGHQLIREENISCVVCAMHKYRNCYQRRVESKQNDIDISSRRQRRPNQLEWWKNRLLLWILNIDSVCVCVASAIVVIT